jgi:hypothetical protein
MGADATKNAKYEIHCSEWQYFPWSKNLVVTVITSFTPVFLVDRHLGVGLPALLRGRPIVSTAFITTRHTATQVGVRTRSHSVPIRVEELLLRWVVTTRHIK